MAIIANNVALQDNYVVATEFKLVSGKQVNLFAANNACSYQIARLPVDGSRDFVWSDEASMAPGSQYWVGANGIRLRNTNPGQVCRVYVAVYDKADPVGIGYTPFTGTVTAQGAVAGVVTPPIGAIIQYGGTTDPPGFFICDGRAISRTTYAILFGVIGTAYGAGDGSTTFNIPDLRGRVPVGLGTAAPVNTLGGSDGVAVANRRGELHRHTPHAHTFGLGSLSGASATRPYGDANEAPIVNIATTSVDGGSGVGTDPLDGGAYQVVNHIIATGV